jgi:hypothetical protein
MSYRDDLAALVARHAALERELAHKHRELAQAARLLEDARARARLPVLDNLQVASPCPARWSQMAGDDRVRHCGVCRRHVYNLSSMTRDEAEALILEQEGRLCVRYFQRDDGTILFDDDCGPGALRRRRRVVLAGAAAVLAGAAAALVGAGVAAGQLSSSGAPAPALSEAELQMREVIGKYDGVRPAPATQSPSPKWE